MEKVIYFDMDGTIANLYGVQDWEKMLLNHNSAPYARAKVMLNMHSLARILNALQRKGYYIGIISWLSRSSTPEYDEEVTATKKAWLKKHLSSVHFDEITITSHGTPKARAARKQGGILFDDELGNRRAWNGIAFDEKNILEILRKLRKNA